MSTTLFPHLCYHVLPHLQVSSLCLLFAILVPKNQSTFPLINAFLHLQDNRVPTHQDFPRVGIPQFLGTRPIDALHPSIFHAFLLSLQRHWAIYWETNPCAHVRWHPMCVYHVPSIATVSHVSSSHSTKFIFTPCASPCQLSHCAERWIRNSCTMGFSMMNTWIFGWLLGRKLTLEENWGCWRRVLSPTWNGDT